MKHSRQVDGNETLETHAMYVIQECTAASSNKTPGEGEVLLQVVLCSFPESKMSPFTLNGPSTLFQNQEKSATCHRFTAVHP